MKEEKRILIATRIKGAGDSWVLDLEQKGKNTVKCNSLTETLETFFQNFKKHRDFVLCPLKGELYVIEEMDVIEKPAKSYNIYGE